MPPDPDPHETTAADARIALHNVVVSHADYEVAQLARLAAVQVARDLGLTWDDIADVLGMSRPLAHKTFSRHMRR